MEVTKFNKFDLLKTGPVTVLENVFFRVANAPEVEMEDEDSTQPKNPEPAVLDDSIQITHGMILLYEGVRTEGQYPYYSFLYCEHGKNWFRRIELCLLNSEQFDKLVRLPDAD